MAWEDEALRQAAFAWLQEQVNLHGEVLPRRPLLESGFAWEGRSVPLVGPAGIWTPRGCRFPISITTSPRSPYGDAFEDGETLAYCYRGSDPGHRDNRLLREAWRRQVPVIYFHGVGKNRYHATWPVFIVEDVPDRLRFFVRTDDERLVQGFTVGEGDLRRRYATGLYRRRLHQQGFRERVLVAYRQQCAICRLRHPELLEAAHIIPDPEEGGEPVVSNGLALCRLHHGAYDRDLVGIRPDRVVEVRRDVLDEEDGPMLRHGLQGIHGGRIQVPRRPGDRPDPERLEERYERFRAVG